MNETEESIEKWQRQWLKDEGWLGLKVKNPDGLGLTVQAINNLMDKMNLEDEWPDDHQEKKL